MSHIDLPHALENYFAHAEVEGTRDGRRFCITLPYLDGTRLDRLQWWWQLGTVKAQILGEGAFAELRAEATERFRRHVEQWLANNALRLHGDEPIPRIGPAILPAPAKAEAAEPPPLTTPNVLAWPHGKVANG